MQRGKNVHAFLRAVIWAPTGFFCRNGQIRGSGDRSPPAGSRAPVEVWGKPQKLVSFENNAYILRLLKLQTTFIRRQNNQNTLQHFQWGKSPLAHVCII